MGHRDLLVTHNLSEDQNNEPRSYLRGSVRRASGFVLTGKAEVIPGQKSACRKFC